jgi:hypothetical protein
VFGQSGTCSARVAFCGSLSLLTRSYEGNFRGEIRVKRQFLFQPFLEVEVLQPALEIDW